MLVAGHTVLTTRCNPHHIIRKKGTNLMAALNPTPPVLTPQDIARFWDKVHKTDTCWEWQGAIKNNGYGVFNPQHKMPRRTLYAHRVAYFLIYQSWPILFVLHSCDKRCCCNPEHLFLGTCKDNLQDMARKGRSSLGEKHWRAKLTEDNVLVIRDLATSGLHPDSIANAFQITRATVSRIMHRKIWKHVK